MTSGKYIRTEQHKKKLRNRFKGKDNNNYKEVIMGKALCYYTSTKTYLVR